MFSTTDFIKLNSKRSRSIFYNDKYPTFFWAHRPYAIFIIIWSILDGPNISFSRLNSFRCFKFLWTEKKIFFRWEWTIKSKHQPLKSVQINFSFYVSTISSNNSPLNHNILVVIYRLFGRVNHERTSQGPFTFAGILASLRNGNQLLASICRPHFLHLYMSLVCLISSSERFSRWPNVLSAPGGSIDPVRWSISWIVGLPFLVKKYSP